MLHMSDDNNDELFRRAAEHYPVKTDSADWDLLRAKMDASPEEDDRPAIIPWWKRYRFLWLLLLLIPLGIAENKYKIIGRHFITEKEQASAISAEATKNQDLQEKNKTGNTASLTVTETGTNTQEQNNKQAQQQTGGPDEQQLNTIKDQQHNIATNNPTDLSARPEKNNASEKNSTAAGRNNIHSDQKTKMRINNSSAVSSEEPNGYNKDKNMGARTKNTVRSDKQKQKMKIKAAVAAADDAKEVVQVEEKGNPETGQQVDETKKIDKENTLVAKEEAKETEEKTVVNKDSAAKKEPVNEIAKTGTKPEKKKENKSKKHFYVGLIAGPDFSTIKLQSVKKTGINFGFIAGYKINNRFSVETGILKDKKFYSSKGQYFSTKNIYLPPNATIEFVDGECNMIEWPLNITYSFRQRKRSGLFASAGVSSYFMKDESYVYDVSRNGYRYPYSYKYKNKSTALLAAINISAGYTYKMGKIADLRIEPYIKLPVGKIGTGELPIQSVGVMVGVSKTIF